ncbi:Longin-like domain [Pseudocohnilembus persalinus]|uniref:Longin-like domain n=1 Tax=Pseudocohnilembus persalinus TaxID=266149 RepID=A0A0V0QWR2_PSEPJ|nr:Longin-like domain [Pseudocohnilembus persalinus]|eukprot:KRX06646.1 Longin-like domain [Pseudocohnilembus persalinus]
MSIIYSAIYRRKKTVLVDCNLSEGSLFLTDMPTIIQSIQPYEREQISAGQYKYLAQQYGDYQFICMCDINFSQGVGFKFLEKINQLFLDQIDEDQRENAVDYGLNSAFKNQMKTQMLYFKGQDKVGAANNEVEKLKDILQKNIKDILGREQRIDIVLGQAQNLQNGAKTLEKNTNKVKWHHRLQNWKGILIAIFAVLFFGWLISSLICGFKYDQC